MLQRPTYKEVFDVLLRAIWSNRLSIQVTNDASDQRQPLLRVVNIDRNQPGIVFYEQEAELPPDKIEFDDGSANYDVRKWIYLPREDSSWTSRIVIDACASLDSCTFDDYAPDPVLIALGMVDIKRKALAAFCDAQGYPRPDFWFGAAERKKGSKLPSFPGRPSVMGSILVEFRRRVTAGKVEAKVRDEARALSNWAEKHIKRHQLPGMLAIENAIRAEHRQLRGKQPNP